MGIKATFHTIGLALVAISCPALGTAQAAESCGNRDNLLFHCTFDQGAKQVGLCLSGDVISYRFGADEAAPELTLTRSVTDVTYAPRLPATGTIFERVTLQNGNTGYTVSAGLRRQFDSDPVTIGDIVVTLPGGQTQRLECDAGSIIPAIPSDGIGQLAEFAQDVQLDPLSRCLWSLSGDAKPATCLGTYRNAEMANGDCEMNADDTQCWQQEAAIWDGLTAQAVDDAMAHLEGHYDSTLAPTLQASQESWTQTRSLDCQIAGSLPFAPDGGAALCRAEYAAARLHFIKYVLLFAEFDG